MVFNNKKVWFDHAFFRSVMILTAGIIIRIIACVFSSIISCIAGWDYDQIIKELIFK